MLLALYDVSESGDSLYGRFEHAALSASTPSVQRFCLQEKANQKKATLM